MLPPRMETAPESIDRFRIVRELGRGGMGVVYEAIDGQSGEPVALKLLRETSPQHQLLLKNEFRALADVRHPNLVSLRELHADGDRVFLTMELLEGRDLLRSVRGDRHETGTAWVDGRTRTLGLAPDDTLPLPGSEGPPDATGAPPPTPLPPAALPALRERLGQVAEGLAALHAAGLLHRDVKPSNVLVADGRAVLLDFGLVTELQDDRVTLEDGIAGSVPYMAPEQAAGQALTSASDWYAFGAMLYEALVGHPPFTGTLAEVFRAKQTSDPRPPSELVDSVPGDVESLCLGLLDRDPARRPGDSEVLATLGRSSAAERAAEPARTSLLVGRDAEQSVLTSALVDVRRGRAAIVHVRARSGIGKSALCAHVLEGLQDVLVLRARCFERDSVPFKALDPLVDQLARWLTTQPTDVTRSLVPRYARELVRLFPVLSQVPAIAEPDRRTAEAADPREQRRRAFSALRELMARLAERHTVIVHLDDLQWGDRDSAELLLELTRQPDPPSMLLVASYRVENEASSPMLQLLRQDLDPELVRTIDLEPFDTATSVELATRILRKRGVPEDEVDERAATVAREAAGSPFFVTELAWGGGGGTATLDAMLQRRAAGLDDDARNLLEAIALTAVPLSRRSALAIARVTRRSTEAMTALEQGRFVRGDGPGLDDRVECYHDRVREAVVDELDAPLRQDLHGRIATTLEAAAEGEPELLVDHYLAAGHNADAARCARRAIEDAERTWAFDRAAAMLKLVLELEAPEKSERATLLERLAATLSNAGRRAESAKQYEAAAALSTGATRWSRLREASGHYMWAGFFDRGRELLYLITSELGLRIPRRQWTWTLGALLHRLRARIGGLRLVERDDAAVDPRQRERIETLLFIGLGALITDQFLAFYLLARGLNLAYRHGTRRQQVYALAADSFVAQLEPGGRSRGDAAFTRAVSLAEEVGALQGLALAHHYRAIALVQQGVHLPTKPLFERAEHLLSTEVEGGTADLGWVRLFLTGLTIASGQLEEGMERLSQGILDARALHDVGLEVHLRIGLWYQPHLLLGAPDRCEASADEAMRLWNRPDDFDLMTFYALMTRTKAMLYRGADQEAYDTLRARARDIRRSGARQSGTNRALHHTLLSATALAAASSARGPRRTALLREALRESQRLGFFGPNGRMYSAILAMSAGAGLADEQTIDEASRRADEALAEEDVPLMRLVSDVVRAHATGGDVDARYAALSNIGVVDPRRWLRTWAPLVDAPA